MNPRRLGPGWPLPLIALAAFPALAPLAGCAASDAAMTRGASGEAPNGDFGAADAGAAPPNWGGGATADAGAANPEVEVEGAFDTPAATGSVVWSANAISGRVTAIVAATLDRVTANAGNGPANVVAIPGATDTAAVLNELSNDATILRYASRRITTETVRTHETANAWAVAPTGPYAIAWTDASRLPTAAITQGFQELDVITTTSPAKGTRLAVGYRPFAIAFDASGANAVVASRDGLTLIACNAAGGPRVLRHVPVAVANRTGTSAPYEFALTPNGRFAVVRVLGEKTFDILALDGGEKRSFTLAGPITDIDLSADGSQVYAVVARPIATDGDAGQPKSAFYTLPVDATAGTTPTKVELPLTDLASTSVSANGTTAVFYTNGIDLSRVVVMGLVGAPTFRTVELYAPVLAVFPAPNGDHALALHKPVTASSLAQPIGAFSLVPLKSELPSRIIATPGRVSAVATSPASDRFVVLERSDERAAYAMHVAEVPVLTAKRYELASPPTAVGLVPAAQRAFAAQVHPQGRISFVDLPTGLLHTLTGFELGAR
jgi:hypothetical protein